MSARVRPAQSVVSFLPSAKHEGATAAGIKLRYSYPCRLLTLASDTSIFTMFTTVYTNPIVRAVIQPRLIASACHIVQPDGSSSLAKGGEGKSSCPCVGKSVFSLNFLANRISDIPLGESPSCLHTTSASEESHRSSQTVPQAAL